MTGPALVFLGSNVCEAADATASKTHGLVGWLLFLRKQESSYCWDVVGGQAEKTLQRAALQRPPRVSFAWQQAYLSKAFPLCFSTKVYLWPYLCGQ